MKRHGLVFILLVLAMHLPGCNGSQAWRSEAAEPESRRAGSGWVGYAGLGVGALSEAVEQGGALASGTRMSTYPDLGLEQMSRLAVREAAGQHRTLTYHQPATARWLQADPLLYDNEHRSVMVLLRVWRNGALELEEYRRETLSR